MHLIASIVSSPKDWVPFISQESELLAYTPNPIFWKLIPVIVVTDVACPPVPLHQLVLGSTCKGYNVMNMLWAEYIVRVRLT